LCKIAQYRAALRKVAQPSVRIRVILRGLLLARFVHGSAARNLIAITRQPKDFISMRLDRSSFALCSVLFASLLGACTTVDETDQTGEATQASTPVGASGALLSRAHLGNAETELEWNGEHAKLEADTTLVLQQTTLQAGGDTGWHSHTGPVIVHIASGTVTMSDAAAPCATTTYAAGTAFIDAGKDVHHVHNPSTTDAAVMYAEYFVPAGGVVRVDQPAPAGADACP
jgi:quercetin dioxygenase-like cupin family protein